ncbi:MAG: rubrerythrin [Gammaproteobacteria bacterium]|nr:MAG: rubrerythrin [Gammaproteobacteria bacterium]RLA60465.1 MAG: rubrerythrin [Gammaproteobacteria bacterium]
MANKELAEFLAHSVELESEAKERYEELADAMAQHHNDQVAQFFLRMAQEVSHHLAEVSGLAKGMELPQLRAWEFNWPETESPEAASYEALHYRMSLRQAMTLALESERAAESYYRQVADGSDDAETVRIAGQFADEERSHAAELECMLLELPENGANLREDDDEPHMPE